MQTTLKFWCHLWFYLQNRGFGKSRTLGSQLWWWVCKASAVLNPKFQKRIITQNKTVSLSSFSVFVSIWTMDAQAFHLHKQLSQFLALHCHWSADNLCDNVSPILLLTNTVWVWSPDSSWSIQVSTLRGWQQMFMGVFSCTGPKLERLYNCRLHCWRRVSMVDTSILPEKSLVGRIQTISFNTALLNSS